MFFKKLVYLLNIYCGYLVTDGCIPETMYFVVCKAINTPKFFIDMETKIQLCIKVNNGKIIYIEFDTITDPTECEVVKSKLQEEEEQILLSYKALIISKNEDEEFEISINFNWQQLYEISYPVKSMDTIKCLKLDLLAMNEKYFSDKLSQLNEKYAAYSKALKKGEKKIFNNIKKLISLNIYLKNVILSANYKQKNFLNDINDLKKSICDLNDKLDLMVKKASDEQPSTDEDSEDDIRLPDNINEKKNHMLTYSECFIIISILIIVVSFTVCIYYKYFK